MYFSSLFFLLIAATINVQALSRYSHFIKNMIAAPKDLVLVIDEMNHLADQLKKEKDDCYLGWSSEGVIALMSKKRFCTKYTYASYLAHSEELNYLVAIKQAPPKEIVFNSTHWSMVIDDVSIKDRLPDITKYIEATYPTKKLEGTYTIVSR